MNRRVFLRTLTAGVAGMVLDPDRLLWTPGTKTIFLPSGVTFGHGLLALVDDGTCRDTYLGIDRTWRFASGGSITFGR
jgi:hypothetical protein